MASNASQLFREMDHEIDRWSFCRKAEDPGSPQQNVVLEAEPGCSFKLLNPSQNLVDCRPMNMRWAVANVLHFFADTEEAGVLRNYNKLADKFLTGDLWVGAYGYIAMRQIRACVGILKESPHSRRAIVTMGDPDTQDANQPACWSTVQFLRCRGKELDMLVYQRSLNLHGVMPYDCTALTNIHHYVASALKLTAGVFRWTVGSLHKLESARTDRSNRMQTGGLLLPFEVLDDSAKCWEWLVSPQLAEPPFDKWLQEGALS